MTDRFIVAAVLALASAAIPARTEPAAQPASQPALVDTSRAGLAKWVETQQLIAKEKKDWQSDKEILQSRIDLVTGEISDMNAKLALLRTSSHEADAKRASSASDEKAAQDLSAQLASKVSGFEAALRKLDPRLPEPVRAKVKPLMERIPADPAQTSVSLAERYQNVIGILNQIDKSNSDITMVNEVRTLSNGKPSEVRTIYVGLAQAYFVSESGEAGTGRPGPDGWQWQTANELAPSILQVVEVLQNKAKPSFVPLPVTVP